LEGQEQDFGNSDLPFDFVGDNLSQEPDGLKINVDDLPEIDDQDQRNSPYGVDYDDNPYGGHFDDNYGSTGGHFPTMPTPTNNENLNPNIMNNNQEDPGATESDIRKSILEVFDSNKRVETE
jgi:hypothetical protein